MTDGMRGAIKEMSARKSRYLLLTEEWVKKSMGAISKMDKADPDYLDVMGLFKQVLSGISVASEAVDDLVSIANEK